MIYAIVLMYIGASLSYMYMLLESNPVKREGLEKDFGEYWKWIAALLSPLALGKKILEVFPFDAVRNKVMAFFNKITKKETK